MQVSKTYFNLSQLCYLKIRVFSVGLYESTLKASDSSKNSEKRHDLKNKQTEESRNEI